MKFDMEKLLICAFLAACVMCVAAFRIVFPGADARFVRAPESERYGYKIPANIASAAELKVFFGLTARKASGIVKARSAAPFKSAADLERVNELNNKDRERITPFLTFEEERQ